MKRLYIFVIAVFALNGVFAQSFSLNPKVFNTAGVNTDLAVLNSVMMNNTTNINDTVFVWKCISFSGPSEWLVSFCDPFNCVTVTKVGDSAGFNLGKGRGWSHKIDVDYENKSGSGSFKFVIYSMLNPAERDTITVNASSWATSIAEQTKTKTVAFSPNPVHDNFTITFAAKAPIQIEVYNILGSKVKTFTHAGMESEVNVSNLQKGIYFIRFEENGKLYTKQFTKID